VSIRRALTSDLALLCAVGVVFLVAAELLPVFDWLARWAAVHDRRWHTESLFAGGAMLCLVTLGMLTRKTVLLHRAVRRNEEVSRQLCTGLQRYRSLFDVNTSAAFSIDPSGRFTSVNPAAERLTGLTRAELLDLSWEYLVTPAELPAAEEAFAKALAGEGSTLATTVRRADGTPRRLSVTTVPIVVDGEVVGIYGLADDVTDRQRLEERLAVVSRAVDGATEAVTVADDSGRLVYANQRLADLLGVPGSAELAGRRWREFLDPAELAHILEEMAPVLERGSHWTGNAPASFPSGSRRHEVSVTRLASGETLSIVRDVTDREEALQALRESEGHYRTILEQIAEGYFEVDLAGRFVHVNDSLCRQVGLSREELLGRPFDACMDPEHSAAVAERFSAVLRTGVPEQGVVFWYHHSDGTPRAGSASGTLVRDRDGTPVGFRGVMRDVTEERRSDQALQRSEERYRLVASATQEILWDADLTAGTTVWTGAIRALVGIDADTFELDEAWWRSRLHPDDHDAVTRSTERALGDGGTLWQGEYRLRREDGDYATVFARGHIVRDDHGRPVRLVGSMMDVTDRTRREHELRQARREADEANRAKSHFLANMSHEIRTPMNGVIGMVDLLLETDLDRRQRGYAETVRQSGERLLVLINDILDLSKIEAGKLRLEERDLVVPELLARTTAPLEADARRKGLRFSTTLGPGLDDVLRGDPERIGQVLTNLLSNAVKFTEVGWVALRADRPVRPDGSSMLRLVVEDSGIGLTRAQTERLFRPFSQADASTTRKYGGTGLGLAISQELVDLMGGRIGVRSTFGMGSAFTVELPLEPAAATAVPEGAAAPSSGAAASPGAAAERPTGHGQRVLLVEDNDVNQDVALLMLDNLGYKADVVTDGVGALEALAAGCYAAVLMDVQMPTMDGYEATARLREPERVGGCPRTPVVAMTANALQGDRQRALEAGMDDYLAKPVRLDDLAAVLARWVRP
jgi:PAS domain S-box-containing protein